MKKMTMMLAGAVVAMAAQLFAAAPTVTAVTAQQRYPWNGLVDIVVTISGDESDVAAATCTFAATNSATQTALAIAHVTQVGTDSGSGNSWTRRFVWDTNADVGEVKIADVELFANIEGVAEDDGSGGVQLWAGGPYWATCNVGASKPEEYGSYFMWGSTVGHKPSGNSFASEWFTSDNCPTYGKSVSELQSLGYIDSSGNLTAAHDAATAHLGAPWRMPTAAEFDVLVSNCDTVWTTRNGVYGRLVTGRGAYASKSIFLPAAGFGYGSYLSNAGLGCYWSSTPDSGSSGCAWCINFNSAGHIGRTYYDRYCGHSVRPLRGFASSGNATVVSAVSTRMSLDNRTGVRVADSVEQIRYSPAWETEAAGAIAQVSTNGVVVASASEAGSFAWTPTRNGTYEFTHVVAVNGSRVGETLSATFEVTSCPVHYTLKFDANGGIGTMTDSDFIVGVEKCLPMNAFVREGYTFGGWGMAANSVVATYKDGEAVTDVCKLDGAEDTLYALWIPNVITVTFNYGPFAEKFDPCEYTYTVGTAFHNFPYVTSSSWEVKGWFTEMMGGVQYQSGDVLPFTKNGTLFLQAEYKGTNPNPGDDLGDPQTDAFFIETAMLPSAMEMVSYETQLACSGGTEPYWWSVSEEMYLTSTGACSFAEVGEAQGWYDDDGDWEYELPFEFNYCGRLYRSLLVNDNACLMFANGDDYEYVDAEFGDLYSNGDEQDIFIDSTSDHVTFRWKRVIYFERTNNVNCAITLYSNGVIRCAYGDCYGTVREFSLSDSDSTTAYQSQECDNDIVFTPNYLPLGLSLDEDGLISGTPTQAGHYEFDVSVEDDDGSACTKRMSIDVAANPNRKPVVNSWEPYGGLIIKGGESAIFSVDVSDPENETLTYRWIWDDAEIGGATKATHELVTDKSMRGWHALRCVVSDGLWTITVYEWEVGVSGEMSVNADDGEDALQNALSASVDGDVIYVGPGTYSPIANWSRQGVRIVATEGCENTFIDGGGSSVCVDVNSYGETNAMIRIEGFTIENGCGNYGGGVRGAWLIGCVVRNNETTECGGGIRYGRADSCLIVGNSAEYGGGCYYTELHNCTVVGNVSTCHGGGSYGGNRYNTIIWGNTGTYDDSNIDDPLFVDAENGDYSLSEGSPCIGMGENSDVATEYDLAGNARIQNGSVDLGAYESAYALPMPEDVSWLSTDSRTYGIMLDWASATYGKWYRVYRVEDALEDESAELIATVSECEYVDTSAVFGIAYRYWVVPCNERGVGVASEYVVDELLPPLQIVDSALNNADVGLEYDYTLHATGGIESYTWYLPSYAAKIEDKSTFEEVGEAMGWTEDDASWFYELPFNFPVCGYSTNLVEVSDNGVLSIPFEDGCASFYAALNLDLYADPGDIYIAVTNDAVTFRWKRVIWSTCDEVNVSATLYANGRVRMSCDGNSMLVDRGFEYGDNDFWYGVSGDIVLTPNTLPSGVEMDEDGLVSGVPAKDGTYRFMVKVEDGNAECVSKEITLRVNGTSSEPIPEIGDSPTSVEIYDALSGSADEKLQSRITDGDSYNAYRNWAGTVKTPDGTAKAGMQAVRDAPTAWVSFALGSERLLASAPTDADLTIESFEPTGETGKFDFTVSVDGVTVSDEALKENLKQVFGLEGSTSLDPNGFSSDNVDIDFDTPENGKVKFTAGPKSGSANMGTFFMKVKVNP